MTLSTFFHMLCPLIWQKVHKSVLSYFKILFVLGIVLEHCKVFSYFLNSESSQTRIASHKWSLYWGSLKKVKLYERMLHLSIIIVCCICIEPNARILQEKAYSNFSSESFVFCITMLLERCSFSLFDVLLYLEGPFWLDICFASLWPVIRYNLLVVCLIIYISDPEVLLVRI